MFKNLLQLAFIIITVSTLYSEDNLTKDFIKASLKNQENLSYPVLKVKYEVKILKDGKETNVKQVCRYIRTPNYFFLEEKMFSGSEFEYAQITKYDRMSGVEKSLYITKNGYKAGKISQAREIFSAKKMETTYFPVIVRKNPYSTLYESLNEATLTEERKVIDGYICYLLEVSYGKNNLEKIWLGKEIEFCPVLIEKFSNSYLSDKIYFSNYRKFSENFWFPMKIVVEGFPIVEPIPPENRKNIPEKIAGEIFRSKWTNIYKLIEISVGKPVSDEEVKLEFPPGTEVRDELTGKMFKIPEKQS